jgi:1-acyl-sn-glycerol-3-phosphate acyltransferase
MPALPNISRPTLTFFRLITRVWFQLHFDRVLTLNTQFPATPGPLIVYGNHSSWWDPMIAVLLAARLAPQRKHYAPIDEASLKHNRLLARIGLFPVDIASARGARQFLVASQAIAQENGVLWVTPQGRFADTREQPLAFKPGLAALAARLPSATFIPLATEYTHWNTRLPIAFAHFGRPVTAAPTTDNLEQALAQTMDELKSCVLTRNPANFTRLPLWSHRPNPPSS